MIIALFAAAGRVETTQTVLLLAHALAHYPLALVRVLSPYDAKIPAITFPGDIKLIELVSRSVPETSTLIHEAIAASLMQGRSVLLDLPGDCIGDQATRSRIDLGIIPVGPTPLHEHSAATALACGNPALEKAALPGAPHPLWLLGCGRPGGPPAALEFRKTMTVASRPGMVPRTFPVTLSNLTRGDALSLLGKFPSTRAARDASLLLAAVQEICRQPIANSAEIDRRFAAAMGSDASEDIRDTPDRLRDLADELRAIDAGLQPTAENLADAAVLDDWEPGIRPMPVLHGLVRKHPSIRTGRRVRTSEVYAAGPGWARTLSRYYVLGDPAKKKITH